MTGASGGGAVSLDANTFQPLRPFLNCISQPHSLLCTLFLGGHTKFQIILSSIWKVPMLGICFPALVCFPTFVLSIVMTVDYEQIYTLSMTITSFEWASDAMFTRHKCKICLQWLVVAWARIVLLFQRSHCEIYPRLWFLLHYCAIARCIRCTLCDSHCKMYSACLHSLFCAY